MRRPWVRARCGLGLKQHRLRADGKPDFQVKFYGVNKRGETGGAALYESRHAICDDRGPRLVDSAVLFA